MGARGGALLFPRINIAPITLRNQIEKKFLKCAVKVLIYCVFGESRPQDRLLKSPKTSGNLTVIREWWAQWWAHL